MPLPYDPNEPLRFDMILPNGEPLRMDMPGARWDGTVGEVMAALGYNNATPMGQQNLAQIRVTSEWMTQFLTHVNAALTMLQEKGVSIPKQDKSDYPNIGLSNLGMVEAGLGLIRDNPGWFPAEYNRQELADDAADRTVFLPGADPVSQLFELYNDTLHAVNSDILMAIYAGRPYIEQGAKLSGANDERVALFREYFKRNRVKKSAPPTPPTA